jgi:hypothetical protein
MQATYNGGQARLVAVRKNGIETRGPTSILGADARSQGGG